MQYDEKAVLNRVAQGDEHAFEILFHQYRHKIVYLAWKFLQSESRAEDVLQEIFLKVWMNRGQLGDIRNFKAWLTTLTRNHIFNALRRMATEEAFVKELSATEAVSIQNESLHELAFNELQDALQKAVSNLTPQQKRIFELSRVEGLRHEQIAEQLDISRDTVKKHMTDALRQIRVQLKPHETLAPLGILLVAINF